MKLKYTFEMVDVGDETIAVPIGKGAEHMHGVLKLNKEGKIILAMLMEGMAEDTIIEKIAVEYENNTDTIREYVKGFIDKLRQDELLV